VGGLALVWESELYDDDATAIVGRVYNSLGDELSPIFLANVTQAGAQKNPAVTLADDGVFLVAWETPAAGGDSGQHVHGALFRMPHDDDPCVYRGNTFLCEFLGNAILAAPIQFGAGRANGDLPLLGDLDGDGRADPCLRRGGQFPLRSRARRRRGGKEDRLRPPGVPALLADVDGNGAADPCVRTGVTFLCDTAHNGGAAELREDLGLAGDVAGGGRRRRRRARRSLRLPRRDESVSLRHRARRIDRTHLRGERQARRPPAARRRRRRRPRRLLSGARRQALVRSPRGGLELRSLTTRTNDWLLLGNVDGM
jgi:hypothetical protein